MQYGVIHGPTDRDTHTETHTRRTRTHRPSRSSRRTRPVRAHQMGHQPIPDTRKEKPMKTRHLAAPAALAALLALTACGSETEATTQEKASPEPEQTFDQAEATAQVVDSISEATASQEITACCDDAYADWTRFFDHLERPKEAEAEVYLGLPGAVNAATAGEDAGRWVSNMLSDQPPD